MSNPFSIDRKRMPEVWALDAALRSLIGVSVIEVVEASLEGTERQIQNKIAEHLIAENERGHE